MKYWRDKISRNKERDNRVREDLRRMGWNTMVVWECQLMPAVRLHTLEEIVCLLDKTFLNNYRIKAKPKPYVFGEPEISEAAESETEYGKSK